MKSNYIITQELKSNNLITKYIMQARSKKQIKRYYKKSLLKENSLLVKIEKTNKIAFTALKKRFLKGFTTKFL